MPDLKQSLLGHDLGHLRIIAEHWGLTINAPETRAALKELVDQLLDAELISEVLEALPENAILALEEIYSKKGRLRWSLFTRRFGEVREMGPGRRDRERPDRLPTSATEILWYRALVARAFFDTSRGTEEFAYIPSDLLSRIPKTVFHHAPKEETTYKILGRAATATERTLPNPASDRILDHACTVLAGLRVGLDTKFLASRMTPYSLGFIHMLIDHAGLIDPEGAPDPGAARSFLEAPRSEALSFLAQIWLNSPTHNDLHHVPNLQPEGEWSNNPLETRLFIIKLLSLLPRDTWWNLTAFIADVRQHYPDFQRPAGDYDSWYLRDIRTNQFLRGFQYWNDVDGALIRYLIIGPLHWLGIMDLGASESETLVTAFRFSRWADDLLKGTPPQNMPEERSRIHIRSDGRVSVPFLTPRAVRYQLARFCRWEDETQHEYRYRLIPSSLTKARESGLQVSHLLSLLNRFSDAIPPNITTALDRWDKLGTEVRIQDVTILRLGSPQILQSLRNSRAARFLGDPLGPTTILVKQGAGEKVLAILTEMGYFGEVIEDI